MKHFLSQYKQIEDCLQTLRSVLTFCFGIGYIANVFLAQPLLALINTIMLVLTVILSFIATKGSTRMIAAVLLFVGVFLLIYAQAPLDVWEKALLENGYLLAMFIMVPLISLPVRYGGYNESLEALFERFGNSESRFYGLVSVMTAFLGVLVSIASVPLTCEVARSSRFAGNARVLATALSRGFITCLFWAPTTATIALSLQLTGADWLSVLPFGLLFAIVAGFIGWIMTTLRERFIARPSCTQGSLVEGEGVRADADPDDNPSLSSEQGKGIGSPQPGALDHKKIAELILFSALYIVAVMLVGQCLGISIIVAVALMSILVPIIWMAAIKRMPLFKQKVKEEYVAVKLPNVKGQMILFTAAGVLASGISYSGVGEMAVTALLQVTNEGVLAVTILVMALALVCSAFGVHPLVYTTVIGGSLSAAQLGVSPVYLALLLAMGWALGNAVCPTSANTIAVSQLVERSPFKLALNWNVAYVLVSTVILVALLWLGHCVALL